jgi:hypothetical protein
MPYRPSLACGLSEGCRYLSSYMEIRDELNVSDNPSAKNSTRTVIISEGSPNKPLQLNLLSPPDTVPSSMGRTDGIISVNDPTPS